MSDLRRLLFANQTRAYEGYPLVISRSVASRYLKQYQMYGNSEQGVPAGYTPLEYIASTGTQYIKTDLSGPARWVGAGKSSGIQAKSQCILGADCYNISTQTYLAIVFLAAQIGNQTTGRYWQIDTNSAGKTSISTQTFTKYDINFGTDSFNGTIGSQTVSSTNSYAYTTWNIGMCRGANTVYNFVGNIYRQQAYQNGVLVGDFIPAIRNSDNVVGMYDLVSGQFFTNAGTGTFTAGPAGPVLPTPENPIEVISVGDKTVNLMNLATVTNGYYYDANGNYLPSTQARVTDFISAKSTEGCTWVGKITGGVLNLRISYFDSNKVFISQYVQEVTSTIPINVQFTTPSNTQYIRISGNYAGTNRFDWDTMMFVEGSTAPTSYVPYGYQIPVVATGTSGDPITTPIYLNAPLRKVGDYADVLDYKKGQIIRNIGVKVLDGTEDWAQSTTTQGVYRYNFKPANAPKLDGGRGHCMSTRFFDIGGVSTQNIGGVFAATTFLFFIPNQDIDTVEKWTTFLASQYAAGTPVTVYYPLVTPVTESLVVPALPTLAGSTTYTTDTEVKPSNMKGVF